MRERSSRRLRRYDHEECVAPADEGIWGSYRRTIGRTSGEEEDPQGPSEETDHLHSTIRERYHDRRKEEGRAALVTNYRGNLIQTDVVNLDEPQPNDIRCREMRMHPRPGVMVLRRGEGLGRPNEAPSTRPGRKMIRSCRSSLLCRGECSTIDHINASKWGSFRWASCKLSMRLNRKCHL